MHKWGPRLSLYNIFATYLYRFVKFVWAFASTIQEGANDSWRAPLSCQRLPLQRATMSVSFPAMGCLCCCPCLLKGRNSSSVITSIMIGCCTISLFNKVYQGCEGHLGTTIIPSAWSCIHFCITMCMILNGGNAYTFSWLQSYMRLSINIAPGSGCHAQYLSTLWFSLDANKSISGCPRILHIPSNKSCLRLHSVLSSKTLDASSASQFSDPGQWAALTQI